MPADIWLAMMRKYNAHGATDVTGFGILGHAQNLAEIQEDDIDLELERLPCAWGRGGVGASLCLYIPLSPSLSSSLLSDVVSSFLGLKGAQAVNSRFDFRLTRGLSAETSGGLLVLLDPQDAAPFCAELQGLDGVEAHVVGRVVKGTASYWSSGPNVPFYGSYARAAACPVLFAHTRLGHKSARLADNINFFDVETPAIDA